MKYFGILQTPTFLLSLPKSTSVVLRTLSIKKCSLDDAWDKRSDLVLWEDLEGAGGEGGGRGDWDGEDM